MIRTGVGMFAVLALVSGCSWLDERPKPLPTVQVSQTPTKPPTTCPPTGAAITAGPVEPALGHRAMVVTLTNCGSAPMTINGYPEIAVLDKDRNDLKVVVEHDSSYMAKDPGPTKIVLHKGQSAMAAVSWSNTTTSGKKDDGQFLSVARGKGDEPVIWPEWLDLGTTAKVQLTAWCLKFPT